MSLDLLSALSNVLRCNVGVFTGVSLDSFGSFASLLGCQITELLRLLNSNIGNVFVLRVDQLFVLCVDERYEEGDTGSKQGEAPGRQKLDQVVASEGGSECLQLLAWARHQVGGRTHQSSIGDVLGENYSLSLNDEEVDELLDVVKGGLESLLGDLVVSSRAD